MSKSHTAEGMAIHRAQSCLPREKDLTLLVPPIEQHSELIIFGGMHGDKARAPRSLVTYTVSLPDEER